MPLTEPVEITLELPGLSLAGLRFTSPSTATTPHRLLALHGWLDNANSFRPLMPLLENCDIVALDWPGHGHSGHLGKAAHYHFTDLLHYVFQAAERLEWESFHVLGHSLGACIAPFIAVANPAPILSLMMLEASGPLTEPASELPARLQRHYADLQLSQRKPKTFRTRQQAVDSRLKATRMAPASAQLIIERQLVAAEDGYQWRFDSRQRQASAVYLMEEQVLEVIRAVDCPVLTVLADDGYVLEREGHQARLASMTNAVHERVPGHHHMHMDDPAPTAEAVNRFLASLRRD